MQAFSSEWISGVGKSVKWTAGVGGVRRQTKGGIGYANQSYLRGNLKAAAIALNQIKLDENLVGQDLNPKARGTNPIATLTLVLTYESGNGAKKQTIQEALNYLLSDEAQKKAPTLGFTPL